MITGFLVLIIFYFAYRLNRDEGIIGGFGKIRGKNYRKK